MTTATLEDGRPTSLREVWLVTLGHALTHWYPATFYVLLPLIGRELGLSYAQIGMIMTCQFVAGALANLPGGVLVDRLGKRALLMAISILAIGVPYALLSFVHSYGMLLACVALVGIGNNLWHPSAIPALADRYPERKGLALAVHGMGGNAGDALAPLAVGALLLTFGWRDIVLANLLPGIAVAALLAVSLRALARTNESTRGEEQPSFWRDLPRLFANRSLVLLSTGSAFRAMTQSALITFLPLMLANELGYSPFWVGTWLFVLQAAGFAAAPIAGYLSDRMGRRRIVLGSMITSGVVLLFMAFAGRSHAFVFLIALLGFFLYAIRSVLQAWLLEAAPRHMGGTAIGMLFSVQAGGAALGPLLCGMLADRYGLPATFYFLAGSIVVANLFILGMPSSDKVVGTRAAA